MKIIKVVLAFLICEIVISCRSWDASKVIVTSPLPQKLLNLEKRFSDTLANKKASGLMCIDRRKIYENEVNVNLVDTATDKFGYISIKQNRIKYRTGGLPFAIVGYYTFFVPLILGMPYNQPKFEIGIEVQILDSKNNLIRSYEAIGRARNTSALYYGYYVVTANRKSYAEAINKAFELIRARIQADSQLLNDRLKAAGKIEQ